MNRAVMLTSVLLLLFLAETIVFSAEPVRHWQTTRIVC